MNHRHEIDGLRAVAIIPVILFHAGFEVFSGGFIGVDVFFVISGYLITGIIIRELKENRFSIAHFYERRARRILPALLFVMTCCVPFAWLWMLPVQFKDFSQSLVAVSVFASNILFAYKSGYFAEGTIEQKPLLHTWSLGVEEQYYALFPLALIFLWRFGRNPVLFSIMAAAAVSLVISEWGWRNAPDYNFYLATSRAWELFAGSICAFTQFGKAQKSNNILSVTGLSLIVFSVFYYTEATPFPSVYALVPVLGTCLVILYAAGSMPVARLLSSKAFVGIGLVSYSAYLWHQPLFAFARIRSTYPPDQLLMALLSAVSLLLAYGSWKYIETPFRGKNPVTANRSIRFVSGVLILILGVISFGLYGHFSNGRETIWESSVRTEVAQMYRLISDAKNANLHLPQDDGICKFNIENLDTHYQTRILGCFEKFGTGIAILGDSHAIDLFGAISSISTSKFVVGITQGYCRPNNPLPFCQYEVFRSFLSHNSQVFERVIFTQSGRPLLLDDQGRSGTNQMFTKYAMIEPLPRYTVHTEDVSKVHEYLLSLSSYTHVTWLGPRIEPHILESIMLKLGCGFEYRLRPNQEAPFLALDDVIRSKVLASNRGARYSFESLITLMHFDIGTEFTNCDQLFWSDGDHWSAHGEKLFGQRLKSLLVN